MEEATKILSKYERSKKYKSETKEHVNEYRRKYYQKNKEKIKEQNKANYKKHIEKRKDQKKIYSQKHAEKNKQRSKEFKLKNREYYLIKGREYYQKNKQNILIKSKEYREKNKERILLRKKLNRLEKRNTTPCFKRKPKQLNEEEIKFLIIKYNNQPEKFWNPLNDKIYKTHAIWISSFANELTKECINRFMFLLQQPHYSAYSGVVLSENEFSYTWTYKGWSGFKKYTLDEIRQRVWMKIRDKSTFGTPEHKKKLSEAGKIFNQTEKGLQRRHEKSKKMSEFYQTEEGKKQKMECNKKLSMTMKKLIEDGKFTPPITNSWTHWESHIKLNDGTIRKFRSSWEACFYYSNRHMLYENIRVKGDNKTYVSDFFDKKTNTMYEIKPRNRYNIEIDKMTVLQYYCLNNNIKFVWINETNILNYINVDNLIKDRDNVGQFIKLIQDQTIKKIYDDKYAKN